MPAAPQTSVAAEAGYTIAQASRITGMTRRQLEYLDATDLVQPSVRRVGGKRRYYSFFELIELRTIARLRGDDDRGISLQKVRKVVAELQTVRDRPLRECTLISDGDTVFYVDHGTETVIDVLRRWQFVLAVNLHGVEWELRREMHLHDIPAPPVHETDDAQQPLPLTAVA